MSTEQAELERAKIHGPDIRTIDALERLLRWQRVETAPRDGTHILACAGEYNERWTFDQQPPTVVHWFNDSEEPGFYTSVNELEPLHPFPVRWWKPLPLPPATR